jgi:hypothetical protein
MAYRAQETQPIVKALIEFVRAAWKQSIRTSEAPDPDN